MMFNFFRKKQIIEVMPAPGEVWCLLLSPDEYPFPTRRGRVGAAVRDVQDGRVRFDLHFPFLDQRMRVEEFVRKYIK